MNHFSTFYSECVCLNARNFFFFFWSDLMLYFFCIWFLKHLGIYSRWRLTLLRTFIFSEFFHFWVWLLLYATLSNNSNPSINPSINSDSLEAVYYWDEIKYGQTSDLKFHKTLEEDQHAIPWYQVSQIE